MILLSNGSMPINKVLKIFGYICDISLKYNYHVVINIPSAIVDDNMNITI